MATDYKGTNARLRDLPGYTDVLHGGGSDNAPFANPTNDAQRMQNARAYASSNGVDIGSGTIDASSGEFQDPDRGFGRAVLSHPEIMIPAVIGGGFIAGGGLGGLAGGGGSSAATSSGVGVGETGATSGLTSTAALNGGGHVGILGKLGGFLGKTDPTTLALGSASLLKGGGGGQQLQSFDNPGATADPAQSLTYLLKAIQRLGQGMSERGPVRLRSSVVQGSPSPVSIPGLGFQIGGGMGMDPALKDPSLLESDPGRNALNKYDPFQGGSDPQINTPSMAQPNSNPVKRRTY